MIQLTLHSPLQPPKEIPTIKTKKKIDKFTRKICSSILIPIIVGTTATAVANYFLAIILCEYISFSTLQEIGKV